MSITVNLTKAKEIKKSTLRVERKPKLEALDVLYLKAQEAGSDTSNIVAKKKQLRDAPAAVDSVSSVTDLKNVTLPDVGV